MYAKEKNPSPDIEGATGDPSPVWFTLVETRLHGWMGEVSTEKGVMKVLCSEDNRTCNIIPCRSINKISIGPTRLYVSFDPMCAFANDELNMFEVFSSRKAANELDDLIEIVELRF